jgi:hypothetical protein
MKKIKLPSTTVLVLGGLGAFWLAHIANPGFNPIGIMIFLLIPILIFEMLYPDSELDKLYGPAELTINSETEDENTVTAGELVKESAES